MTLDAARAVREVAAGNEAFARSDFGAAIASYEAALQAGADSGDLHFNLGNAYYRAGQLGRAVLEFERALRREPGDQAARHNLQLVRAQGRDQGLLAGEEPFVARVGSRVHPDSAAAGLLVSWTLACALLVARSRIASPAARMTVAVASLALLAGAAAAAFATFAADHVRDGTQAIVIAEDARVREKPEAGSKLAFEAPEGLKVRVAGKVDGLVHVQLPSGLEGYVEPEKLAAIDVVPEVLESPAAR